MVTGSEKKVQAQKREKWDVCAVGHPGGPYSARFAELGKDGS